MIGGKRDSAKKKKRRKLSFSIRVVLDDGEEKGDKSIER